MRVSAARLVHVGDQHAVGAERAGIARNEDAADAELGRDHPGDGRPHAAERHQREFARIVAALDRDGAHRRHHVGREHAQDAPGRLDRRKPSGSATRVTTASRACALEIGIAPSSSAAGLRWPSTTSASVSVGSPPPRP